MPAGAWIDIDWRAHQRWVLIAGAPVNVIELGQGPPVLFVHGLGGSWRNWLGQLPAFAKRHRVLALDLPGFGSSPLPVGPISIDGYVRTVRALMDARGIDRAAVVGNSMGGLIAAELALAIPARVTRLALISPAGVPMPAVERRMPALRLLFPLIAHGSAWIGHHADVVARRPRLRSLLIGTVAHRPGRIAGPLAAEQLRGMGKPGLWPAFASIVEHSVSDRLGAISCPTLIVWGEHDHVVPTRHADVFAAAIQGSRKVLYPDAAHVAMLERPDDVNELLAELFASDPRGGSGAQPRAAVPGDDPQHAPPPAASRPGALLQPAAREL